MNDLEDRLRDAFAARADLVTLDTLRRDASPPAPSRRLRGWVGPTLVGLAVAATAAGALVATGPDRAVPEPPAHRTNPVVTPAPGDVTIRAVGWRAVAPAGWRSVTRPAVTEAEMTCLAPRAGECHVILIRAKDPAGTKPTELGAGLLPLDPDCPDAPAARPAGQPGLVVATFTCGGGKGGFTDMRQLVAVGQGLAALADPKDQTAVKILDRMVVDSSTAPATTTTWAMQLINLTVPSDWRPVRSGEMVCPPGPDACVLSGGIAVRGAWQWSRGETPQVDPTLPLGHPGPAEEVDSMVGCPDGSPTSYRTTLDEAVVVGSQQGRYYEATMTCPDGREYLMRRWWLPRNQLMIDSGGRSATVDEAIRTAEVFQD